MGKEQIHKHLDYISINLQNYVFFFLLPKENAEISSLIVWKCGFLKNWKNDGLNCSFPDQVTAGINAQEDEEQQGEAPK